MLPARLPKLAKSLGKLAQKSGVIAKMAEIQKSERLAQGMEALIQAKTAQAWFLRIAKEKEALLATTKTYNFSVAAAERMASESRMIPVQILDYIIQYPLPIANDPKGTRALMYYSQIWKYGKLYNAEVLYDKATNKIWHFLYKQDPLGPLPRIK